MRVGRIEAVEQKMLFEDEKLLLKMCPVTYIVKRSNGSANKF
jgi:hypothetical protein